MATTAASSSSSVWAELPSTLRETLQSPTFGFTGMLPIQDVVIPYVQRAIRSMMHLDVCLSAPTGSGKTLCYLIPMIQMIMEEQKRVNSEPSSNPLRGVVLVPTKALGSQVYNVAKKLVSGTHIKVVCACGEQPTKEAASLVRKVEFFPWLFQKNNAQRNDGGDEGDDEDGDVLLDAGNTPAMSGEEGENDDDDFLASILYDSRMTATPGQTSANTFYYSKADLLIVTPQRLLKHLGSCVGFHLRQLQMMVIDEADQVLAASSGSSSFTNLVGRLMSFIEPPLQTITSSAARAAGEAPVAADDRPVVVKMLCSATLSTHITRISEVRLKNVKHFSLNSDGKALAGVDVKALQEASEATARVSTKFALPPGLHEHVLMTTDERRPATLLKLIRHIIAKQRAPKSAGDGAAAVAEEDTVTSAVAHEGQTTVVFCGQSDTAKVLSKFLTICGIKAMDFTSTSSVVERRRFVMSGVTGKAVVLVTTDSLMRGVDLPGVGHVVMYDAPTSIAQFVHRVGRTARAFKSGRAYLLLAKIGPSGTIDDGEVHTYKSLDRYITRSNEITYERELQFIKDEELAYAQEKLSETQKSLKAFFSTPVVAAATTAATTTVVVSLPTAAAAAAATSKSNKTVVDSSATPSADTAATTTTTSSNSKKRARAPES